jgi:Ser/Thr protein kinase RdoA (MazF antagonist)
VLPLREIARLVGTVTADRRCPVADAAAAAWGFPPGAARFRRSSASHVFAIGTGFFLRLVPARVTSHTDVLAIAGLMARLHDRGLDTVPVLRSAAGRLVETVDDGGEAMYAMVVAAAVGRPVEVDELTPELARAWGAGLGRLHRGGDSAAAGLSLPEGADRIHRALASFEADPFVAEAATELRAWLDRVPRDYGLVHGDFELDNLAWTGERPVSYDFDEAERSWFAADIASAVRELTSEQLLDAFLAGYQEERPSTVELAVIRGFTAVNALCSVVRLAPVLAEAGGDERLRAKVHQHAERQRRLGVELATGIGRREGC